MKEMNWNSKDLGEIQKIYFSNVNIIFNLELSRQTFDFTIFYTWSFLWLVQLQVQTPEGKC